MGDITMPATVASFQYSFLTGFETPPFDWESSARHFPLLGPQETLFHFNFIVISYVQVLEVAAAKLIGTFDFHQCSRFSRS